MGRVAAAAARRPRGARAARATRASPPGAASSRRSPSGARRCSSSKTCTGPTRIFSTSSTSSSTGSRTSRSSWSLPRGPSCSTGGRAGEGASANAVTLSLVAAHRRRHGAAHRRAARPLAAAGRDAAGAARARRRQPALRRAVRADVRRARRGSGELPETVRGSSPRGSTRFYRREKSLLFDAAVLGKTFWIGALQAEDAETRLRSLQRKEFVRRERRSSVAGETSSPSRTCSSATSPMRRSRARSARTSTCARHRWIESLAGDRAEDLAEQLAHHYVAALELRRAAGAETEESRTPQHGRSSPPPSAPRGCPRTRRPKGSQRRRSR